jgi:hypothetical protein
MLVELLSMLLTSTAGLPFVPEGVSRQLAQVRQWRANRQVGNF